MNLDAVEKVVRAVLYEGYVLYPYRASAVKNRQRFNFGSLYPREWSRFYNSADAWSMHTECLVAGQSPQVSVLVRFLHIVSRRVGKFAIPMQEVSGDLPPEFEPVEKLTVGDAVYATWQEVIEQSIPPVEIRADQLGGKPVQIQAPFSFAAEEHFEPLRDQAGLAVGLLVRSRSALQGVVQVTAERVEPDLFRIAVEIQNHTPIDDVDAADRHSPLAKSLASTHSILTAREGRFVSLLDPEEQYRAAAASCSNTGCWPVLVGEPGTADVMLSSPIILYDYPQIAPESQGDFFDGTEIDEILTLRVMTLTDDEKREMRGLDSRVRRILERSETMQPEQMSRLHGIVREKRDSVES